MNDSYKTISFSSFENYVNSLGFLISNPFEEFKELNERPITDDDKQRIYRELFQKVEIEGSGIYNTISFLKRSLARLGADKNCPRLDFLNSRITKISTILHTVYENNCPSTFSRRHPRVQNEENQPSRPRVVRNSRHRRSAEAPFYKNPISRDAFL